MPSVTRFEELEAWKRSRVLARHVYSISSQGKFSGDKGLSRQIQRSAVSVMSNIAEGFERYRLPEFHQFLSIAKGSCAELRSQLFLAKDLGYIDESVFTSVMTEAEDVSRLLGALRASVRDKMSRTSLETEKHLSENEAAYLICQDSGLSTQD